jgi:hypothetical protein
MVAPTTDRRTVTRSVVLAGIAVNALAAVVSGGLHLLGEPPPLRVVAWPGSGRTRGRLRTAGRAGRRGATQPAAGRTARRRTRRRATRIHGHVGRLTDPGRARGLLPHRLRGLDASGAAGGRRRRAHPAVCRPHRPAPGVLLLLDRGLRGHRAYSLARLDDPGDLVQPSGSGQSGSDVRAAGSGCASDVVTLTEAVLGLGAAVVALGVSRRLPRSAATVPSSPG